MPRGNRIVGLASAALILAGAFGIVRRLTSTAINRVAPRRVSNVVGLAAAVLLFWSVGNGATSGWRYVDWTRPTGNMMR